MERIEGILEFILAELKETNKKVEETNKQVKNNHEQTTEALAVLSADVRLLNVKMGNTYELIARNEIRRLNGDVFGRNFVVNDLLGMVRVSLPKKATVWEADSDYNDTLNRQYKRADDLANAIYQDGKKAFQERIEQLAAYLVKKPNANKEALCSRARSLYTKWIEHEKRVDTEAMTEKTAVAGSKALRKRKFLISTPTLGIMVLSSLVYSAEFSEKFDVPFLYEELELDCRGKTSSTDSVLSVEIGEVKSTRSREAKHEGCVELIMRLSFVGFSSFVILKPESKNQPEKEKKEKAQPEPTPSLPLSIQLHGHLFMPQWKTEEKKSKEEKLELPKWKVIADSNQLHLPPGCTLDISYTLL